MVGKSYFSTSKEDENKSENNSSGPRLEARFGKLGAFVDRLTDEVGAELKKNKDIQEGLEELSKLKDQGMKQADSLRDQKVGGETKYKPAKSSNHRQHWGLERISRAEE